MGIDTAMFYGIAFGYIIYIYTINDVMVVSSSSKKNWGYSMDKTTRSTI